MNTLNSSIRLENISKSFGSVHANRDISLEITAGRILALLGENGAGKSTLMSILAGRLQPDSGRILVDGNRRFFNSEKDAIGAGIGMVYQHFKLVESMTVAENVFLGQEEGFFLNTARMERMVSELAGAYSLEIDPSARVCELSMGEKQRVEILKLLQRQSSILIFDEPTAVLTPQEADKLYIALKEMARQGKAIVFISHKLAEVMDAADDVSILRKGEVIDNMRVADVTSQAELARRMVGTETTLEVDREEVAAGGRVLDVENLSCGKLKNVSLTVNRGEILGVVGVAGNGQKPLVETVCGLSAPESGSVKIMGQGWKQFFSRFPNDDSLSYIPEDRLGLAVCPTLDLSDNFLLTTRSDFGKGPWLKRKKVKKTSKKIVDLFSVFPGKTAVQAKHLSGGNLQKLVLGREFFRKPRLIVAEQPTQGLDITTTKDIWEHLISARENAGVLLVTGDLNEALALSDRIAVMFDGQIVNTFSASDKEKCDQLGVMMAGIAA